MKQGNYGSLVDMLLMERLQPQQQKPPMAPTQGSIPQQRPFNYKDLITLGAAFSRAGDQGLGLGAGIGLGFQALDEKAASELKNYLAQKELALKEMELTNLTPWQEEQLKFKTIEAALEKQAMDKGVGKYADNIPAAVKAYQFWANLPENEKPQYLNVQRAYLPQGFALDNAGGAQLIPGVSAGKADLKRQEEEAKVVGEAAGQRQASIPRKGQLTNVLGGLEEKVINAAEQGAIPSTDSSVLKNLKASVGGSAVGSVVGRAVGSKSQTTRDSLQSIVDSVNPILMQATGLSARQLDSNVELQSFKNQLGNPKATLESRLEALRNIEKLYGLSSIQGANNPQPQPQPQPQIPSNLKGWSVKIK